MFIYNETNKKKTQNIRLNFMNIIVKYYKITFNLTIFYTSK